MTLAERIAELESVYGSLRVVASFVGIDAGYLSRLKAGAKKNPSARTLERLGLRAVVNYERIKQKGADRG